jgi:hypothetical protein
VQEEQSVSLVQVRQGLLQGVQVLLARSAKLPLLQEAASTQEFPCRNNDRLPRQEVQFD